MAAELRGNIGTLRIDPEALRPGIGDELGHQPRGNAPAFQLARDEGVFGDAHWPVRPVVRDAGCGRAGRAL